MSGNFPSLFGGILSALKVIICTVCTYVHMSTTAFDTAYITSISESTTTAIGNGWREESGVECVSE